MKLSITSLLATIVALSFGIWLAVSMVSALDARLDLTECIATTTDYAECY